MGMLEKVRNQLSLFGNEVIKSNSYFTRGYQMHFSYGRNFIDFKVPNGPVELIEEPNNVIAMGINLKEIKIVPTYYYLGALDAPINDITDIYKAATLQQIPESANKCDTLAILFRFDYKKGAILTDYINSNIKSCKTQKINLYDINELYNYRNLLASSLKKNLQVRVEQLHHLPVILT